MPQYPGSDQATRRNRFPDDATAMIPGVRQGPCQWRVCTAPGAACPSLARRHTVNLVNRPASVGRRDEMPLGGTYCPLAAPLVPTASRPRRRFEAAAARHQVGAGGAGRRWQAGCTGDSAAWQVAGSCISFCRPRASGDPARCEAPGSPPEPALVEAGAGMTGAVKLRHDRSQRFVATTAAHGL
jgi:hypothetical protein